MEERFSYDAVGYPKKLFMQTHPEHLAGLAVFFGMKPPVIESCRVLELGCGDGNSLLAHAFDLPEARFVGIDLAENPIREAQKSAGELNLSNIEFYRTDVMQMSRKEFGRFDFITAHGLFSWVPEPVREKILSLCGEMLAPNGVGYISFNAFPGAHQRKMAAAIMRYFTRDISDPDEKAGRAVDFLGFLTKNAGEEQVYQAALGKELERFVRLEPGEIFHDDLAETNRAFYFHEFASLLEKHGLQFLADADLHAMFPVGLTPEAARFINSIEDIIEREQYIDFFRGQTFRQVLFCRKEIKLNRRIEPSILRNFLFKYRMLPVSQPSDPADSHFETFVGPGGSSVEIGHPLTKAALVYLGQIWARSAGFSEMLEAARKILAANGYETDNWPSQYETASEILLQICCQTNLIKLHLRQSEAAGAAGEKPKISDFARWQITRGSVDLLTLDNISVSFEDDFTRHLLYLLDGTRDRDRLIDEMQSFLESSENLENRENFAENLPDRLNAVLRQLARVGMLES